jgi:NUDIX domain.
MRKMFWMLIACLPLCGQSEDPIVRYLELRRECPAAFGEAGNWQLGESQTIFDEKTMREVQAEYFQEFLEKGLSQEEAARRTQLGVVCEDGYWVWVREALRFPSGRCDIYNRFIHKYSLRSFPGEPVVCSVILAQLPNEKIAVNLMFRNGTRSWEIELPRGGIDPGERSEDAARREILEETGYMVEKPSYLGAICLDSASMPHFFHLYFAKTAELGATDREEGEIIASVMAFSKEELKLALAQGQMEVEVNGRKVSAFCRDHHMAYAILLAETKGLL